MTPRHDIRPDWPDDWRTRRDPDDYRACRALWAAALAERLRGAAMSVLHRREGGNYLGRAVPADWIGSAEFALFCDLAGVDAEAVAARLRADLAGAGAERALSRLSWAGSKVTARRLDAGRAA